MKITEIDLEYIEMAKANDIYAVIFQDDLLEFAHSVAKREREACAKLCETLWNYPENGMATEEECYGYECAKAIRERGKL